MKLKLTIILIVVAVVFIIGSLTGLSAKKDIVHNAFFLPQTTFNLPVRFDPNEPVLKYALSGSKWRAMLGGKLALYGFKSSTLDFYFSVNYFLELHNISKQPIPWDLFRANIGGNLFFELHDLKNNLFKDTRLFIEFGFNHESDHVANFRKYEEEFFIESYSLYNIHYGNLSSYEYFTFRLTYHRSFKNTISFLLTSGLKRYMSINFLSLRKLRWSHFYETSIGIKINKKKTVTSLLSLFIESTKNDFISGYNDTTCFKSNHNKNDYIFISFTIAFKIKNKSKISIVPYIEYSYGNGKGADFLKVYNGIGGGVKLIY